jgi:hypothetical protein
VPFGEVAVTASTLDHRGASVFDQVGQLARFISLKSQYMKGKPLGLPCSDTRELFKVGNELVEGVHDW